MRWAHKQAAVIQPPQHPVMVDLHLPLTTQMSPSATTLSMTCDLSQSCSELLACAISDTTQCTLVGTQKHTILKRIVLTPLSHKWQWKPHGRDPIWPIIVSEY